MKVGELFLALGLAVEDKEWSLGQAMIDQMAAEIRRLAVEAKLATTDVNKAMATIGVSAPSKAARRSLRDLVGEGNRVSDTFKRMAVAAASFFAVDQLRTMVAGTAALGAQINDTAQKTGLSRAAIQEFGHAASLNSSSVEDVSKSSLTLAKNLEKLAKGEGKEAKEALQKLGISLDDPAVKARDLEKIMYLTSSAFSQMEDSAYKAQIASALFGESGVKLIPTLNQGVQGLADLRREARDMGTVMEDDAVRQLADLDTELGKSKAALTGLKNQIVIALVPAVKDMAGRFREWVKENREVIRTTATKVVGALVVALKTLGSVIAFAVKHWKLFAVLLGAMTIVNGIMAIARAIVLFQTIQLAAAAKAVGAWLLILGPIALAVAAVVAIGLVIYRFRDKVWTALRAVGRFFMDVWRKIKDGAASIAAVFVAVFGIIKNAVVAVVDFIAGKIVWVIDKIKHAIDKLGELARNFADAFGDGVDLDKLDKEVRAKLKAKIDAGEITETEARTLYKTNMGQMLTDEDGEVLKAYQQRLRNMQGATGAATGAAPAMPARSVPGSGNGVNNTTSYQINIDAKNADAKEVATLVDQKLREHDELQRRQTAASLGIG